jgi:hypothetical protein
VNAKDDRGRSCLELAIYPSEYGTLQNLSIIEALLKSGCNSDLPPGIVRDATVQALLNEYAPQNGDLIG